MNNLPSTHAAFSETIVIVGAGAAGLMAARELSAAGKAVIVLEAADEPGGRIRTTQGDGFIQPVEEGAEFVHGDLPLTLQLLRSAGISYHPVRGKMIHVRKGKWLGREEGPEGWGELMEKMQQTGADMPLSVFLSTHFYGEKNAALRDAVRRFAEGFDLADVHRASTRALSREWSQEEGGQYRIEGGYGRLIEWMAGECRHQGCRLHFSSPVEKIAWEAGRVSLTTRGGAVFSGGKTIITVPLGMLQYCDAEGDAADDAVGKSGLPQWAIGRDAGIIRFLPGIGDRVQAARRMGYGTVIKILLQFSHCFWNKKDSKAGFFLSDEPVPTWWTQFPDNNPLLTGWMPGALLETLRGIKAEDLPELCLSSLARIFGVDTAFLKQELTGIKIVDWGEEPFIRGGYSFETVESAEARQVLNMPLLDTLYFAGEALYEGDSPATVEAAFDSGKKTAEKIIARH